MDKLAQELETLPVRSMVKIGGKEQTVVASITLQELYQQEGSSTWIPRGKHSRGLVLDHQQLLLRLPQQEGGSYHWLQLQLVTAASSLREFYKGGDSLGEWGPARRFAKQQQTGEVRYRLLDTDWYVRDIGTFQVDMEGESPICHHGDRLYFVTSHTPSANEWLLYLDARPGEAQGTGGLFRGVPFIPSELIEEVL